jgi:YfiH family protein
VSTGDTPENARLNRLRDFEALGLAGASMADVWQVHGDETIRADAPRGDRDPIRADGLITDRPGVSLFQRFADCVPILLYDPVRHAAGMVHSGWRGTVTRAAASPVRAMVEAYGTRPADLLAGIGPSIGPDHYPVGPEVVAAVQQAFGPAVAGDLLTTHAGQTCLDLWAANARVLREAGVRQIEIAHLCTACHTGQFFSHRAEAGRTGRFGAVIALC